MNEYRILKKILYLTAALTAAVCFFWLSRWSDPTGGDGYFYLKQIKSLFQKFYFYHADYSLFFIIATLFRFILKTDLQAFQLMNSLVLAGMAVVIAKNYLSLKWRFIWVFALLLLQTPILRLSFEFAKQGLGLVFFLAAIHFWFRNRTKYFVILWVLSALTHKIFLIYTLPFLLFWTVQFIYRKYQNSYSKLKYQLFIVTFSLIFGVCALALFVTPQGKALGLQIQYFIINFEWESIRHYFNDSIIFSNFYLAYLFLFVLVSLFSFIKIKDKLIKYLILIVIIPLIPVFSGANSEIKYRLLLNSTVISFFLWPYLFLTYQKINQYLVVLIIPFGLLVYSEKAELTIAPWVQPYTKLLPSPDRLEQWVKSEDLLVAHHGLQFYIDYFSNIRAFSMVNLDNSGKPNPRPKYQVAYAPQFFRLEAKLSDELRMIEISRLSEDYALYEYESFQQLMKQFSLLNHRLNIIKERPLFVPTYDKSSSDQP